MERRKRVFRYLNRIDSVSNSRTESENKYVRLQLTLKDLLSFPARASSNVVLPAPGGPSSRVILKTEKIPFEINISE